VGYDPKPQGNDLSGGVWDGEGFIAVGDAGTIMTSSDGIN